MMPSTPRHMPAALITSHDIVRQYILYSCPLDVCVRKRLGFIPPLVYMTRIHFWLHDTMNAPGLLLYASFIKHVLEFPNYAVGSAPGLLHVLIWPDLQLVIIASSVNSNQQAGWVSITLFYCWVSQAWASLLP